MRDNSLYFLPFLFWPYPESNLNNATELIGEGGERLKLLKLSEQICPLHRGMEERVLVAKVKYKIEIGIENSLSR